MRLVAEDDEIEAAFERGRDGGVEDVAAPELDVLSVPPLEVADVQADAAGFAEPETEGFADAEAFAEALAARNQRIHGFLRDQHGVAGLGRMLANEICHRAKLSPFAMSA